MDEITNGFITLNAKSYFGRQRRREREEEGNFGVEDGRTEDGMEEMESVRRDDVKEPF